MGPAFSHHMTEANGTASYTYTRTNAFGANESRVTTKNLHTGELKSLITFSDGKGRIMSIPVEQCRADNFADYQMGGPQDGFMQGDYSHIFMSRYVTGTPQCTGCKVCQTASCGGCRTQLPTSPNFGCGCGTTNCNGGCSSCGNAGVVNMAPIPMPLGGPPMMDSSYPQTPKF